MATRKRSKKDGRLHLRLDDELVTAIHDYAKRNGTSANAIAEVLFRQLLATEKEREYEAEQV